MGAVFSMIPDSTVDKNLTLLEFTDAKPYKSAYMKKAEFCLIIELRVGILSMHCASTGLSSLFLNIGQISQASTHYPCYINFISKSRAVSGTCVKGLSNFQSFVHLVLIAVQRDDLSYQDLTESSERYSYCALVMPETAVHA